MEANLNVLGMCLEFTVNSNTKENGKRVALYCVKTSIMLKWRYIQKNYEHFC